MPTIVPLMPFREDKDLGRAYNEAMALLPDDGWAIFLDHDMMFTTPYWFAQCREAIEFMPDAGAFAVVTNRIASPWQRAKEAETAGDNVHDHRAIGEARRAKRTLLDITQTKGFGGVVTVLSKAAWRDAGGYAEHAMYCVDHSIHFKLGARGRKVYLIEGLYVYHFRGSSSARPPLQAGKVPNCPCRGPELQPTRRIALP